MISQSSWGDYKRFTLDNGELSVVISDLGATILSLKFRGKERVIGYETPEEYLNGTDYLGATIGRYGNRIAGAAFTLNGKRCQLSANEGKNQLHGGNEGLPHSKRAWKAESDGKALRFTLVSPDGDNGFPGTLTARVTYRLDGATLRIDYEGLSDADTHYAPTNHSYFDLSGAGDCMRAQLQLNAERYLTVDEGLIPVSPAPVEGTRFDFRSSRAVGEDYDHCFVLSGSPACVLRDGGTALRIFTDFPAIQVYTGINLSGKLHRNQAIALEPEAYPNSPNRPDFPSSVLRANESFRRYIEYRFAEE